MAEANNPNQMVFGLDIGTRSIVGTVGYKKGKQFVVVAQCNKEHETRAMLDGQIHDIGQVAETIKDVKRRLEDKIGGELHRVCIAAAGRVLRTMQTHVVMELDEERAVTSEDIYSLHSLAIEEAYKEFIEKNNTDLKFYCVGSSVVRYYLNDLTMSNLENHKAKHIGVDMIATFLPDDVVDGLYKAVEMAGLEVANMTLEPIAAIQLAIPERFRLLNIALVDVGAGTSDISITKDGTIIAFGMIPTAGDSLTEKIANHCMVDFNAAEIIKRKADTDDIIEYEDIMGIKMTITKEEIAGLLGDNVDEMATLACDKIKELNGGKSVGAVFVVGGGGMIPGYTEALASKLGLAPERVALRGKEVMQDVIFESTELKVDSLLVTPIGICLNFYEESNNFIFVRFNDTKIKLYNNSNLTIMDAAMQTDFPSSGFFPKSGPELDFTVNGKARMARGDMGEPAVIKLNGSPANLHSQIKENDIIEVTESTAGAPAHMTISALPEFKSILKVNVNGTIVELPKFAAVNGTLQSEYYDIQTGDEIVILDYYTVRQILTFMDVDLPLGAVCYVNNQVAEDETRVYENFTVSWKMNDGSVDAAQYTYEDLMGDDEEENTSAAQAGDDSVQPASTASQPTVEASQSNISVTGHTAPSQADTTGSTTESGSEPDKVVLQPVAPFSMHVIVNRAPVTLTGKSRYVFVDIFDFISFDRTKVRGSLVTKINGRDAVYMEEIREGDVIEVYWK